MLLSRVTVLREIRVSLTELIWLATACYGVHILEEYQLDWRGWARTTLKLPVEWTDFYVVNALVIVLGIVAANLAAVPMLALAFPALMLINATFFHVLPFLRTKGRFSPGLISAVVLFYPVGIAAYWRAAADRVIDSEAVLGSLLIGAALMAWPVVLLLIKDRPYFRQR
jgi:hypothetical protein